MLVIATNQQTRVHKFSLFVKFIAPVLENWKKLTMKDNSYIVKLKEILYHQYLSIEENPVRRRSKKLTIERLQIRRSSREMESWQRTDWRLFDVRIVGHLVESFGYGVFHRSPVDDDQQRRHPQQQSNPQNISPSE